MQKKIEIVSTPSLPSDVLPPTQRFDFAEDAEHTELKVVTIEDYWKSLSQGSIVVEPLKKSCHDCAIKTNYYTEFAKSLADQPEEIRKAVLDRWYCHNHNDKGCAGVRSLVQKKCQKKSL